MHHIAHVTAVIKVVFILAPNPYNPCNLLKAPDPPGASGKKRQFEEATHEEHFGETDCD